MSERLDDCERVSVVAPENWITYDGAKMFPDGAGKLPVEPRTEPEPSERLRLRRELERRGLA